MTWWGWLLIGAAIGSSATLGIMFSLRGKKATRTAVDAGRAMGRSEAAEAAADRALAHAAKRLEEMAAERERLRASDDTEAIREALDGLR